MPIRFPDKLEAIFELADADAEAHHDRVDGFVPDSLDVQWSRAVSTMSGGDRGSLLLISLMNAGYVVGVPRTTMPLDRVPGLRETTVCEYAGLTESGRQLAVEHGWIDVD